jgi:NTE family protein
MDIALALGGGGVRGVAHIGVLRALEAHGFQIKAIAGTSAGGLVGAVYAAGKSTQEIETAAKEMDQHRSFGRASDDRPSLLGLSSIANKLSELLADRTFDDLQIPFAATAVSLQSGKEIILRKGKVLDAVLATIAIPGVFPCKEIGGRVLIDGGVLDPIPVQVARWMRPDLPVVAVVLHQVPEDWSSDDPDLPLPIPAPSSIVEMLTKLRPVQAFKIFTRSMEVATNQLTELSMHIYEPEVIIKPQVGHIGILQNIDVEKIINAGMDATEEAINRIKAEGNWVNKIRRQVKQRVFQEPSPEFWENIED